MKSVLPPPKPSGLPADKIRKFAEALSKALRLKPGASLKPIVERLKGTLVKKEPEPGASCIEVQEDEKFTIFLSTSNFPLEERFTIAHELGHLFLHSLLPKRPIKAEHSRAKENEDAEIEAHEFARAFLVPEKDLREAVAKIGPDSLAVAAHFMVPQQVVLQRMKAIGLIQ